MESKRCRIALAAAVACGLAVCLALCGCMERKSEVAEQAHTKTLNREPITLATEGMDYGRLVDAIHHEYPDIKVNLVSYAGADAAQWSLYTLKHDDAPDVFSTEELPAQGEQAANLFDLTGQGVTGLFNQQLVADAEEDGHAYLVPGVFQSDGETYTVQRYYGISKTVAESGDNQKLQDAINVLKVIGSLEGQEALQQRGSSVSTSSLADESQIGAESRVQPASSALTASCVRANAQDDASSPVIAHASRDFSLDETTQIVARIYGETAGADVAMLTEGGFHGTYEENELGVNGKLYEGDLTAADARTVLPGSHGSIDVVELSGSEINDLVDKTFVKYDNSETGGKYPYTVMVKGGGGIDPDATYKVAMAPYTYSNYFAAQHDVESVPCDLYAAAEQFFANEGTVDDSSLNWQ